LGGGITREHLIVAAAGIYIDGTACVVIENQDRLFVALLFCELHRKGHDMQRTGCKPSMALEAGIENGRWSRVHGDS
jgi:hypothetical protein